MLSAETRHHTNDAEVTATVIDGEAIMINLTSGVYYSTDGVGARVWQLAAAGTNISDLSAIIAKEYDVNESQARTDAERLLEQFLEEQLLLPYEYATTPDRPATETPTTETLAAPYATPQLEIYREMGHLLALDPPMPGLENIAWDETRHA